MRYIPLFLVALAGACVPDDFGMGPGTPSSGSYIRFTHVNVSPTQLRAGVPFQASASGYANNCGGAADLRVIYARQSVSGTSSGMGSVSVTASYAAVLGETVVSFYSFCLGQAGPVQVVRIQVLPAQ